MSEAIIVAIIGAIAVVLAAIIGLFKKANGNKIVIKQKAKGNKTTQIGIQTTKKDENQQK